MTATTCTVCKSRAVHAINAALERGDALTAIGRRYHLSRYAIARHKDAHLFPPGADPATAAARQPNVGASMGERLAEIEVALSTALQAAHRRGSMAALVPAARELRATLEVLHRMRVEEAAQQAAIELDYYESMRCVRQALVEVLAPAHVELLEAFERRLEEVRLADLARKVRHLQEPSRPLWADANE